MPPAAIDVNDHALSREYDVGAERPVPRYSHRVVHPEPQAQSMKLGTETPLGTGVAPPVRPHDRPSRLGNVLPTLRGQAFAAPPLTLPT